MILLIDDDETCPKTACARVTDDEFDRIEQVRLDILERDGEFTSRSEVVRALIVRGLERYEEGDDE